MSQKLAQALRCQLLTGSFEGNERSCPCESPDKCQLTRAERIWFKDHPDVLAARERNKQDYENNQGIVPKSRGSFGQG